MVRPIQPSIHCKSADEFLKVLSPLANLFYEKPKDGIWLFRGQGKDYPLVPSIFRRNGNLASLTDRDVNNPSQFLLAERDILIEFFDVADKRGLVLPDDSQALRLALETLRSDRGDKYVEEGCSGWHIADQAPALTALAQHYGLPTRLLDWSRQSYTAAFFAAESALGDNHNKASENEAEGNLVVWAFCFPLLGRHDAIKQATDPVKIVTAPSATNPNLKAQQGVFTFINPIHTNKPEEYPALDSFLQGLSVNADPDTSASDQLVVGCKLRKFSLPASQASELLCLLAKLDVTPSAIYPGYHSIVADLRMRKSWQPSRNA